MKTKKNLFICLLTVFMSVFAFFGIMTMSTSYVSADSGIFEMKDAAGIRLGDHSGIRFFVEMDETHKEYAQNNEYGFLVFPQEYLTTKLNNNYENFDEDFHNNPDVLKVIIEGTKNIYTFSETDDGAGNIVKTYAANAALLDVKENNFKIKFTCVAYVVDNNGEYIYAINEDLGKSMQEVASMAYFDTENVDNEVLMATYGEESTTFNYNLGSTDNPILITDAAQLSMISEEVEAGTTDYAGMNFQLANNIALDNGFTPIASTFAGNILGDGKQVSGELVVELVDGKTATELNYVENVIIPTHFLELNSDTFVGYDAKTNPDGEKGAIYNASNNFYTDKGTLVSEETWKADGITGDYSGNAIKYTAHYYTNWTLANKYNLEQLNVLLNNYDYVKFYIAAINTNDEDTTWYFNLKEGLVEASGVSTLNFGESTEATWVEVNVSINNFISLVSGADTFSYFNSSWNKAGGVEGNNAARTVIMYISDIEFGTKYPNTTVVSIEQSSNWREDVAGTYTTAPIYHGDYRSAYVSADAVAELNFAGSYSGDAVISYRGAATNSGMYRARHSWFDYSPAQKKVLQKDFTHVRFYVAVVTTQEITGNWYFTAGAATVGTTLIEKSLEATDGQFKFNASNENTWIEFNVPIADFVALVTEDSPVGLFQRVGSSYWNGESNKDYINFYFSEMTFVNIA